MNEEELGAEFQRPSLQRRLSEAEIVQNPALGAQLIWAAASSHVETIGTGLRIDLCFVILPLVLRIETQNIIGRTQSSSGLGKFILKLEGNRDLLLGLHGRALEQRALTLQSLSVGVACKLLEVARDKPLIQPLALRKKLPIADEVKPLFQSAERLGAWFSQLSPPEVMATLRIHV